MPNDQAPTLGPVRCAIRWLFESRSKRRSRERQERIDQREAEWSARRARQAAIDAPMVAFLDTIPDEDRIVWINKVAETLAHYSECGNYSIGVDPMLPPEYCAYIQNGEAREFDRLDAAKGFCERHRASTPTEGD